MSISIKQKSVNKKPILTQLLPKICPPSVSYIMNQKNLYINIPEFEDNIKKYFKLIEFTHNEHKIFNAQEIKYFRNKFYDLCSSIESISPYDNIIDLIKLLEYYIFVTNSTKLIIDNDNRELLMILILTLSKKGNFTKLNYPNLSVVNYIHVKTNKIHTLYIEDVEWDIKNYLSQIKTSTKSMDNTVGRLLFNENTIRLNTCDKETIKKYVLFNRRNDKFSFGPYSFKTFRTYIIEYLLHNLYVRGFLIILSKKKSKENKYLDENVLSIIGEMLFKYNY